jgi:cAMP-dependent protein kinase regulator
MALFSGDDSAPASVVALRDRVQQQPHDLRIRRELAEHCRSLARTHDAIDAYQSLAGAYAAQGLLFRAISICKEILELDPLHSETHQVLASLYAKKSERTQLPTAMAAAVAPAPPQPVPQTELPHAVSIPAMPVDDEDVVDVTALASAMTVLPEGSIVVDAHEDVPLFSRLSRDAFVGLVKDLRAFSAEPGTEILLEGEESDSIYVIAKGRVRVEKQTRATDDGDARIVLAELTTGAFFGEVAWLSKAPRGASVVAVEQTELLELSSVALETLSQTSPAAKELIEDFCKERLLLAALSTSPVFVGVSTDAVKATLLSFEPQAIADGAAVVRQGEASPGLCLVLGGVFDVTAQSDIGTIKLKRLQPGDVFGEMSLLDGTTASATVTAAGDARLLQLPRATFQLLSAAHPSLLLRVQALSAERSAFNDTFVPRSAAL